MNRFLYPLAVSSLFAFALISCCDDEETIDPGNFEHEETVYTEQKIELDTDGDGIADMTVGVSDNNLNVTSAPDGSSFVIDETNTGEKYCYMDTENNCDDNGGLYTQSTTLNNTMAEIFNEYTQDQATKGDSVGNPESNNLNGIVGGGDGFVDETGEAIKGYQGICPDGWHIPSDAEWIVIEKGLGMSAEDAFKYGPEHDRGADVNLRDQFVEKLGLDFNGYFASNGNYAQKGEAGVFASSTPVMKNDTLYLIARQIDTLSHSGVVRTLIGQNTAISIRCFKD